MTDDMTPVRSSWIWLIPGAVLAVGGAIWLWFLSQPRVCILIFPPPPGCNSAVPYWLPYIGIALLALLLIVLIVLVVRRAGRRALLGTVIAMIVVVALFVAVMYLSFAGVFDLPVPLE